MTEPPRLFLSPGFPSICEYSKPKNKAPVVVFKAPPTKTRRKLMSVPTATNFVAVRNLAALAESLVAALGNKHVRSIGVVPVSSIRMDHMETMCPA